MNKVDKMFKIVDQISSLEASLDTLKKLDFADKKQIKEISEEINKLKEELNNLKLSD